MEKTHLTLFIFCTTAVFSSIFAKNGSPANCCNKINPKQVRVTSIVSYWKQNKGLCPVTAIVFTLNNGKFLCSNPVSPWTKKAMRKLDEEAKQKRNHRFGLAPDAPKESTEGLLTATMMPLTSRWPQVPASVAMPMEKSRAESPANVKSSTPKKQKQRRKGRNKVGKRKSTSRIKIKIKIKKQPVLLHTSSFTTSSYK